ncbi:hypothetical protein IY145_12325 [Methylosinus sp. H3A]|uniref:hypothetical protein n=1 Tax=Methylosinus sp. H3A TaxID=2785786 RepID=UPI0018C349C1|nr:hypothetical protein [Methylosinus sp. H3A]MBG0810164.1 hypothetical protein [Methylosinus sp. H3A]
MEPVSAAPSARPARRASVGRWGLLVCALLGAALAPPASAASNNNDKPPAFEPAPAGPPIVGKSAHEPAPTRKRLTKFEARRIRHACQGRANERSLAGPEREAFLGRCYFGRVSTRVERQQCRQEAAARGVDRSSLRAFVRECVRERLRAKEDRRD